MRTTVKLLSTCVLAWLVAFLAHRVYLSDVVAISNAGQPQTLWKVEAAFLLTAVENIAAAAAAIVFGIGVVGWLRRRARSWCHNSK